MDLRKKKICFVTVKTELYTDYCFEANIITGNDSGKTQDYVWHYCDIPEPSFH